MTKKQIIDDLNKNQGLNLFLKERVIDNIIGKTDEKKKIAPIIWFFEYLENAKKIHGIGLYKQNKQKKSTTNQYEWEKDNSDVFLGQGTISYVVYSGKSHYTNNTFLDPRGAVVFEDLKYGNFSWLGIPIWEDERLRGVFSVGVNIFNFWDEETKNELEEQVFRNNQLFIFYLNKLQESYYLNLERANKEIANGAILTLNKFVSIPYFEYVGNDFSYSAYNKNLAHYIIGKELLKEGLSGNCYLANKKNKNCKHFSKCRFQDSKKFEKIDKRILNNEYYICCINDKVDNQVIIEFFEYLEKIFEIIKNDIADSIIDSNPNLNNDLKSIIGEKLISEFGRFITETLSRKGGKEDSQFIKDLKSKSNKVEDPLDSLLEHIKCNSIYSIPALVIYKTTKLEVVKKVEDMYSRKDVYQNQALWTKASIRCYEKIFEKGVFSNPPYNFGDDLLLDYSSKLIKLGGTDVLKYDPKNENMCLIDYYFNADSDLINRFIKGVLSNLIHEDERKNKEEHKKLNLWVWGKESPKDSLMYEIIKNNIITLLDIDHLYKLNEENAIKSAISAIASRNMSHIHGSHIIPGMRNRMGSLEGIIERNIEE